MSQRVGGENSANVDETHQPKRWITRPYPSLQAMDAIIFLRVPSPATGRHHAPDRQGRDRMVVTGDGRQMGIGRAINIEDVRQLAKRRLPRITFDFADGGVEDETALARNREAFQRYRLVPRYLVDVSARSQATTLFGHRYASPFGIAPMGVTGFFRPGADLILARAAAEANVPYIMSSASCDRLESALEIAPETTWFQLYGTRNPGINEDLVRRAQAAGVRVLIFTLDTPIMAKRERNMRNGYRRPMKMTMEVILQGLAAPAWTWRYLRAGGIPLMQNWQPYAAPGATASQVADLFGSETPAPAQTWEVLEAIRRQWRGPLVAKGVLHPADAKRCVDMGVDGLIVSNHGGRQLDSAPSPMDMLPAIASEVGGRAEILIDGGFRRGSDVLKALCLGANAALFGRPAIFGAAAAGAAGAARVLDIFRGEIDLVMGQMGWTGIDQLGPERLFDTSLGRLLEPAIRESL
jgi:(S)-mandelate dehydrogenase